MTGEQPTTRRRVVVGAGAAFSTIAGAVGYNEVAHDYRLADAEIDGPYFAHAGADEGRGIGLFPYTKLLTLTCWLEPHIMEIHPHAELQAVSPNGDVVTRTPVQDDTWAEVLREERYYRLRSAQEPGEHRLRIVDSGTPFASATIIVRTT